jgi:hypothetical protein
MYATLVDLSTYMAVAVADLPATAQRDLDYAEDVIKTYTMNKIDITTQAEVAKRATLAQYDMMTQNGGMDAFGQPQSMQIGSFQMAMVRDESLPELSPRAKRILFPEGLLYSGVFAR